MFNFGKAMCPLIVLGFWSIQSCHGVEEYGFDMLPRHSFADITSSEVKRSLLACAKSCAQKAGYGQCNMASYDKVTRLCSMKYGDLEDIVPFSDSSKVVAVISELVTTTASSTSSTITTTISTTTSTSTTTPLPTTTIIMSQWVNSVLSFSSEWSNNGDCSAYQVAGPPDVYPTYGDVSEAWAPKEEKTAEFLELLFLTSVHVTDIDIYETHLGGAVSAVKCYQNGGYTTLWTSPSIDRITVARRFRPQLATGCFSNRIKFEIAPITGWVNIDAVQLHGYI